MRKRSSASRARGSSPGAARATAAKKRPSLTAKRTIRLAALASGFDIKVPRGAKVSATVSTRKVCQATTTGIRGIKAGTCRATLTITPRKGKATKRAVSFQVVT